MEEESRESKLARLDAWKAALPPDAKGDYAVLYADEITGPYATGKDAETDSYRHAPTKQAAIIHLPTMHEPPPVVVLSPRILEVERESR